MLVWVQVPSPADAEVAELADAHGSGPCGSNTLWVRLPSSARDNGNPNPVPIRDGFGFFSTKAKTAGTEWGVSSNQTLTKNS